MLISTLDADGRASLAPFPSAWWLGYGCMPGMTVSAHTARNLRRTGERVVNLPSSAMAAAVDRLALTTGADPVPPDKAWLRSGRVAAGAGQALSSRSTADRARS